ncbi:MAG TPA: type III glutamate--ammonia ligase [Chloroflexota bacterium]
MRTVDDSQHVQTHETAADKAIPQGSIQTVEDVKRLAKERGIEFILCSFVEMSGAPKAKVIPVERLDDADREGAAFAGFAAGELGQGPHDPDMVSMPDWRTLTILPWRPNVAWVAGNVYVEGKPWPYCPRSILQRQMEKARQQGFVFKTGVEAEFFLVRRKENGAIELADPKDALAKPCYDMNTLERNLDFLATLVRYTTELGWAPHASDHEDANCQFEVNWLFSDALTTADRHTFYKFMVKTLADQRGLIATFMPKPFANQTGNGAHFHMSLWDAETGTVNLFEDPNDENGLSQLAYWWIGGLLKHAKALAAVTAPTVNSYKRLIRGAPRSGATWAPVYITYGGCNRTQMIRIPAPGRVENRTVDGSANPYLAATVTLAAGLDGIANRIDPGRRNDRNLYEVPEEELKAEGIGFLPRTLSEALDELEKDDLLLDALGREYAAMYLRAKRAEWERYHNAVSQWEIDTYLPLF